MDPSGVPELAHPVGPRSMLYTNRLCVALARFEPSEGDDSGLIRFLGA
jgi:hypothetical protein